MKVIAAFLMISLIWLEEAPAYASSVQLNRLNCELAVERSHQAQRATGLPEGLTQTPDAALLKKIAAKQRAAREAAKRAIPDVRALSATEMSRAMGRGPLRNPYFNGTLPWQRSFHDVNLSTGNLFKSFTDIQVGPARGTGLVLQRTYNSNDATPGPFGVGWTHAYDIRIQEATDVAADSGNGSVDTKVNDVPRTDFFGGKHTYHRDADGLYSPPPYMYDELSSDYNQFLIGHPASVITDTETGMDGTVKHYATVDTNADGTTERACDYIQDRFGNTTALTYGLSYNYTRSDSSTGTRKVLTQVTDEAGRSLIFHWTNLGSAAQPAYRITEIDAPTDPGTGAYAYRVTYDYYTDTAEPNAANDLYNLKAVHLDPDGLNRVTTYTYTSCSGTYINSSGSQQTTTENGLLASIIDPLGHTISYQYSTNSPFNAILIAEGISPYFIDPTGTIWVTTITEPAGVDTSNNARTITWTIGTTASQPAGVQTYSTEVFSPSYYPQNSWPAADVDFVAGTDTSLRYTGVNIDPWDNGDWGANDGQTPRFSNTYDSSNNVIATVRTFPWPLHASNAGHGPQNCRFDTITYGQHGNQLTDTVQGFAGSGSISAYYNASQYFHKQSDTDFDGNTTFLGIGTNSAGKVGDADPNIGDRGNILQVQDAGYNDPAAPTYHKQYTYTYNQYGQKITGTSTNGIVTNYYYKGDGSSYDLESTASDPLGSLIAEVQDPGSSPHVNRITTMHYDIMGHVVQRTDPKGQRTATTFNKLGQPLTLKSYSDAGITLKETITYTYDTAGRTGTVSDNRGTTTLAYETGSDRISSATDPVTGTISYKYGLTGVRTSVTLPDGRQWNYYYKAAYPTYNPEGTLNPYTNSSDPADSISDEAFTNLSVMPKDDLNSVAPALSKITDSQGRSVYYNIFMNGQIQEATTNVTYNSGGGIVSYCTTQYAVDTAPYTLYNSETHGWLNQTRTTFHWTDTHGTHHKILSENKYTFANSGMRLSNTVSVQTLDSNGYGLVDGSGNPVMQSHTELYTYDKLNRLSTVDYGGDANADAGAAETQTYTFDAAGNRKQMTDTISGASSGNGTTTHNYVFDNANRLTSVDGAAYTNDANGNTLTGGGRVNTWDSENRLVSCAKSGTTSTFTYGADGLRRSSTVTPATGPVVTTAYVLDCEMLVQERRSSSTYSTYFGGPRGPECRIDETANTETGYTGGTAIQRGPTKWYVYDGMGSVVAEVDPLGNTTASTKYDVYGAARATAGTSSTRQGFVGSLGHVTDSETGLVYMRARYYDPAIGRFVSEDSKRYGFNWYEYAGSNPINSADATGENPIGILSTLISAVQLVNQYFAYKAFIKILNDVYMTKDSADVENEWGDFMNKYNESPLGDYSTEIGIGTSLADWGLDQVLDMLDLAGSPIVSALTTIVGGGVTGASMAILCLGYEARLEWYVKDIDRD